MRCDRPTLCRIIGVSSRTLGRYLADGLPVHTPNKGRGGDTFETVDVIQWLVHQELGRAPLNLDAERARLAHAQAITAELRAARERLELVESEIAVSAFARLIGELRSRLLGLGVKIAPRAIGLESIPLVQAVIDDGVRDALGGFTPAVLFEAVELPAPADPAAEADPYAVVRSLSDVELGELSGAGSVEERPGSVPTGDT